MRSTRFRLFRFRSPLLTESLRFLFLWLLRCFTSPGTPPRSARKFRHIDISIFRYLRAKHGSPWFARRGCPIRSSPDQSPLDGSPKLIAVTPRPSSPLNVKASSIRPCLMSNFLELVLRPIQDDFDIKLRFLILLTSPVRSRSPLATVSSNRDAILSR